MNCSAVTCPEIPERFFKITQIDPNKYMVERLRESSDPKFDAVDLFDVEVKDA